MSEAVSRPLAALLVVVLLSGCFTPSEPVRASLNQQQAFLWNTYYPHLLIELDHVEGEIPSEFAVDALVSALRNVTGKQRITVAPYEVIPRQSTNFLLTQERDTDELMRFAREHRDFAPSGEHGRGDTAVLHVLYVDVEWEEGSAVGLEVEGTIFLFRAGLPGSPTRGTIDRPTTTDLMQRTILIHEAGHAIGLVNAGLPMVRNHEDPDSRAHSSNPKSVMRAGADAFKAQVGTVFPEEAPPFEFDADDLADIRAFQALEPRLVAAGR